MSFIFTDAQYSAEQIYHNLFILPLFYMKGFFSIWILRTMLL